MLFSFLISNEDQTVFRNEVTGLILTASARDLLLWGSEGRYCGTVVKWSQYYVGSKPFIHVTEVVS